MNHSLYHLIFIVFLSTLASCSGNQGKEPTQNSQNVILAYLYPGNSIIDPSEIPGDKLTHIVFSFADIQNGEMAYIHDADSMNLWQLIKVRDEHPHLKIMVAVGGWTRSGNFSDMALTSQNRKTFIDSAIEFIKHHQLDGIDLDWEYPGLPGYGNIHRPEDKENFTALLQELRSALDLSGNTDQHLELTIAAGAFQAYLDNTEMHLVARYCDYINLMTYDFTGAWENTTGHHTNLYSPPSNPGARSVDNAVNLFAQAGVPHEKIVIGAAFYGKAWGSVHPAENGLYQPAKGKPELQPGYNTMVRQYTNNEGYQQLWDTLTSAPWLWNTTDSIFITYDNPRSINLKVQYCKENELAGIMFWQLSGDADNELVNTINNAFVSE